MGCQSHPALSRVRCYRTCSGVSRWPQTRLLSLASIPTAWTAAIWGRWIVGAFSIGSYRSGPGEGAHDTATARHPDLQYHSGLTGRYASAGLAGTLCAGAGRARDHAPGVLSGARALLAVAGLGLGLALG